MLLRSNGHEPTHTDIDHGSDKDADEALERISDSLAQVTTGEFLPINVDLASVASLVLAVVPRVQKLRNQILEEIPKFDVQHLDNLVDLALGTWSAHVSAMRDSTSDASFKEAVDEGMQLRKGLTIAGRALVNVGLLEEKGLDQVGSGRGHAELADDPLALANLFRDSWPKLKGKTAVTKDQVDRAATLGSKIVRLLGVRTYEASPASESMKLRSRAFTALAKSYSEVRRAVQYVRWDQEDLDDIVPSLYSARAARRSVTKIDPAVEGTPEEIRAPGAEGDGAPGTVIETAAAPTSAPNGESGSGGGSDSTGGTSEPS